jgi:hypothetical protein
MNDLQVRWIIEPNVLDYTDRLVQYLSDNNINYKETNYQEVLYHDDNISQELLDENTPTIFVGSLRTAREVNRYPVEPGAICSLKRYECLNYYPSWYDYLINDDYELVTTSILKRETDRTKTYFFRPNEGDKRFTGGLYSVEDVLNMKLLDNQILIKASKKCIGDEYRFLVVDRQVVDGSRYISNGYLHNIKFLSRLRKGLKYYNSYLEELLEETNLFIPDRAFTVDIGQNVDTGLLGVIEINSFSCANLYEMDMNKVVPAINQLAVDIYQQNTL